MAIQSTILRSLIAEHKSGTSVGIPALCTAHPVVLETALAHARDANRPVLIESTCNQVNHRGGYTGQTPSEFVAFITGLAARVGLPRERLILGGDHLGPGPWQARPADQALDEARALVAAYSQSGYAKLHLDPSMPLAGDPSPLPLHLLAKRSADLAAVAEAHRPAGAPPPVYVVGSEVPVAGGLQGDAHELAVTTATAAADTLAATRDAFHRRGLADAWSRVVALVVQPGVEYGDETVIDFDRAAAASLSRFINTQPGLVYEAHSTDYQAPAALRALVEDHFAILKVGPALTFAYREAIFALEMIEREWLGGRPGVVLSGVRAALDTAMLANPASWRAHYHGDMADQARQRAFSYSDRARYYWPVAEVGASVARLHANLSAATIPPTLLSQFMPRQHARVRAGELAATPPALVGDAVAAVLDNYAHAAAL